MGSSFFKGKRPWSTIKDRVLGQYMPPYLAKVATLRKPIILIDAFAGPGRFEDGSPGSPLIICEAAEKYVPDQYQAIFVNRDKEHHDSLSQLLSRFIDRGKVVPIHGTAETLITRVRDVLADHTVFLYLDPFGLKGCEFSLIEPLVRRNRSHSTEVVINLSTPTMHRLAARRAVAAGRAESPLIRSFNERLSQVLGGEYWKEILWSDSTDFETKAQNVMLRYRENILDLQAPRGFSGSCPVRERQGRTIKYFITFYSRHQDAMILMNDAMCEAYQSQMHGAAVEGTLFEGREWKETRGVRELRQIVLNAVTGEGGRSRLDVWVEIVQSHFMQFLAMEYRDVVATLVKEKRMDFEHARGTGRLNDESRLYLRDERGG